MRRDPRPTTPSRKKSTSPASHAVADHVLTYSSSLQRVGNELRRARKDAGLTLRQLGQRSDLSSSFLSLVERGECSLSLTSLFAISEALGVPATSLIDADTAQVQRQPRYRVWQEAEHDNPDTVIGERAYTFLYANFPDHRLEPMTVRIRPTTTQAPPTTHAGEEFAYVIEGQLTFIIDGQEEVLSPGQTIHYASSVPHSVCNRSTKDTTILLVVTADYAEARQQHGIVQRHAPVEGHS